MNLEPFLVSEPNNTTLFQFRKESDTAFILPWNYHQRKECNDYRECYSLQKQNNNNKNFSNTLLKANGQFWRKVRTFNTHGGLLDSGPPKAPKSLRNSMLWQSLGPPQRAYTLDSNLRNCSQQPPVTAIVGTSSPSPRWYQTAASPSKGKNRGRGRQKRETSQGINRGGRWENP